MPVHLGRPVFSGAGGRGQIADMLRRHGPFEPHRLPLQEMEDTTLPKIMGRLADRFKAGRPLRRPARRGSGVGNLGRRACAWR